MTSVAGWPTLPRTALVRAVVAGVEGGTSVGALVHGEPGVGKTTLALAAAAELAAAAPDTVVLRLRGSEVTSSVAYGLLHGLLHEADDAAFGTPSSVLRHLTAVIGERGRPGSAIVVVDNAHLIDEYSAHALGQLAALGRAVVIAAVPSLAEAPEAFLELWRDGMLASVPVPVLDLAEVGELLTELLDGPVVAATVALLAQRSGGNPLFLQYLTREQLEAEALVCRDGVWLLASPATLSNQQMLAQLRARLDRWGASQREIMEIVALTDTIPYAELATLSDEDEVSALLANGVLELVPGAQPRVQVRHRLVAEVIRAGVPFARRRQLRDRLAPIYEDLQSQSPESVLAFCAWTLDCGVELGPELALTAAQAANQLYDPEFALRAAAAVPPGPLALSAAVQKSRAWRTLGLHAHAVGVLRRWFDADERLASTPAAHAELAVEVAAVACLRSSESDMAETIVAEAIARGAGDPVTRRLELARWELRIALGDYQGALPGLEAAYETPVVEADGSWFAVAGMFAEALAAVGKQQEALAVIAVIEQTEATGTPSDDVRRLGESAVFGALLNCGMWDKGISVLSGEPEQPVRGLYFGAAADSAIGVSHLYGGRARDALDRLPSALGQLTVRDALGNRRQVLAALAYSYALLGESTAAQNYLRELDDAGPAAWQVTATTQLMALNAQALVGDDPEVVTGQMLALADDYRAKGVAMDELVLLAAAARMGSEVALEQLQTPWMPEPGPMAAAIHQWARAVKTDDAVLILDAAGELLELGNVLLAREAATSVARTATGALKSRAQAITRRAGDALRFAAEQSTGASVLTKREQDVATRAAAGRTNKEIADELFLSVRTVESYLQSAFGKLGITSRADLAGALVP